MPCVRVIPTLSTSKLVIAFRACRVADVGGVFGLMYLQIMGPAFGSTKHGERLVNGDPYTGTQLM